MRGEEIIILRLKGFANADFSQFSVHDIDLLDPSSALNVLQKIRAGSVVLAGSVHKPGVGAVLAARQAFSRRDMLRDVLRGGDDNVLRGVIRLIEDQGFPVIGLGEAAPSLMVQPGLLTRRSPDPTSQADISLGFDVVRAMGAVDIGQAVIVAEHRVLAVEAVEGTDAMIRRVASLRKSGPVGFLRRRGRAAVAERTGGVLVKAAKPGQDMRADLPVIGPNTVQRAAEAGLFGIAVEAGAVLVVEMERTIAEADKRNLFILGVGR